MAGNDFDWNVIIRLATQGARKSVDDLNTVAAAQDRLNKAGKITEKGLEANTRAINKYSAQATGAASANNGFTGSANALRYANYDLARSLFTVSAAITATGAATAVAFASQESAFTEVERIVEGTSAEIADLRGELQGLSTEIPQSFQSLSGIASLGAALGIESGRIATFTEVVAKFAATTGITTEAAATGIGRIAQNLGLAESEYDNLGSAVLKAGNISVATEEQVLKFAQAISLPAARAGILTDQVVALGAATASFANINVEGAGSAFSRIFADIDRSVSEGGESLENFARASGMSAQQFAIAWKTNAGGTFNDILKGLAGNVEGLTGNLDALGIVNERDRRVVSALAINYDKYNQILGETTSAWREGIYMNEAYGLVLDDLNSKWTIFLNAVTNAAAAIGAQVAPALKTLLDVTTDILVNFAGFVESDIGGYFIRIAGALAIVIAAWAALRGATALATGAVIAFNYVTSATAGKGIWAGIMGLAGAMGLVEKNAKGATVAAFTFKGALAAVAKATVALAVLQFLAEVVFNFGGVMAAVEQPANFLTEAIINVAQAAAVAIKAISPLLAVLPGFQGISKYLVNGAKDVILYGDAFGKSVNKIRRDWVAGMKTADDATYGLNQTVADGGGALEEYDDGLLDLGDSLDSTTAKVRTLADYASDLSSVWDRAFEIRFSGQRTLDAITTGFSAIRDASEAARRNIAGLEAEIMGLQSDLNIQKYFLSVAVDYGDTARAEAIQANIAKLQADLANKTAELTTEQEKNNKTLTGNSAAATQNRETISSLVQQYQAHISALASSGADSATLAAETARLKEEFLAQATQLGYSRSELGLYAAAFDDVKVAIDNVPRDITVTPHLDPAYQALSEFAARATEYGSAAGSNYGSAFGSGVSDALNGLAVDAKFSVRYQKLGNKAPGQKGFAGGGFTGRGGRLDEAGTVHRGEYVVPKHDVNQRTGLPYADALGRLQRGAAGRSSYAGGGYVNPSSGRQTVDLSAFSIQQLAQVMDKFVVVNGKVVAETASSAYANSTSQGAY